MVRRSNLSQRKQVPGRRYGAHLCLTQTPLQHLATAISAISFSYLEWPEHGQATLGSLTGSGLFLTCLYFSSTSLWKPHWRQLMYLPKTSIYTTISPWHLGHAFNRTIFLSNLSLVFAPVMPARKEAQPSEPGLPPYRILVGQNLEVLSLL